MESSNPRPRNPRHGCGLQARTHGSPVQHKVKAPLRFSLTESKKIEAEISELLQKGALTNVTPDSDQFVSNLFLVPKRDGGSRPVINLKDLNEYLQYNHFKMEGIHLLRDLMRPNDWLGKVDLKDAYFVVPIWENHKKYLRFLWKDSLLEFACLPFGLAVAPRVFTKIMKPVVALLRRTGIRLIIYLDDLLFMSSSKVGLQQDMTTAQYLLENLGFVINLEKSCFQPTQQLEFLGFVVNTLDMTLLLPDCKVEAIKSHCSKMLLHHEVSVRELSQLIGKLTASIQAIFPSSLALSAPAGSETQSLSPIRPFRCYDRSVHGGQGRTSVVASAFECLEWEGTCPPFSRCDNRNRRLSHRLGGSLPGRNHGGLMVPNGEKTPYQLLGTSSGLLCCQELYKGSPLCSCAVAHGQCLSGSLYQPPRGYSFPDSLQFSTSPLGMGSETQHISQCRTSIGGSECVSGLGVAPFRRLERLEALPSDIPLVDAGQRSLRARPVRESSERPVSPVLQLEAGSDGPSNRRSLAELGNRETIRIPPLLSYNALSGEAQGRGGRTHTGDSGVANTGLVSESSGIVGLPSDSLTLGPQITSGPTGSITPVGDESNPATSRSACVQRSLQSKGISSNASKLILAAWRPSTNSVYNSAWKKWHCWCIAREVDPLCPSLADITRFLAHSFDEGLEYRTINTYRSALSGVLPPMEGFPVGQHPLVVRLLKGILNLRPAMPRYQQSWDVNVALDYMRSLPGNQVLPLKVLTQKLALLLALTAPKRSSELKLLDLRFMRILPEGVVFELPGMTKTSSEIIHVFFAKFDDCESICVLRCLQSYISRTNIFRPLVDPATNQQLLISYHRPHKPVQSCTIARWIKSFLGSAGIDTSIFKGHPTRSASTSKARAGGISLEDVLKMADWTGPSSFLRFYYRPSFTDDFARAVLQ